MTAIIAWCIFIVLTAIAAIHVAWGFGTRWPRKTEAELVTTVSGMDGTRCLRPSVLSRSTVRSSFRVRLH